MDEFLLHSTKYDRSLHYRHTVRWIWESETQLVTWATPGRLVESYRGSWTGTAQLLSMFWLGRPCVLHVRWDEFWRPEALYIDIATDVGWLNGTVRYVDMDLDLILRHGSSAVHLNDEDEFEANRVRWSYPVDLVDRCRDAAEDVRRLLEARQPPFSPASFAWRPGEPLMM